MPKTDHVPRLRQKIRGLLHQLAVVRTETTRVTLGRVAGIVKDLEIEQAEKEVDNCDCARSVENHLLDNLSAHLVVHFT